eukprot:12080346-Karenia_brevis.AAC.1
MSLPTNFGPAAPPKSNTARTDADPYGSAHVGFEDLTRDMDAEDNDFPPTPLEDEGTSGRTAGPPCAAGTAEDLARRLSAITHP